MSAVEIRLRAALLDIGDLADKTLRGEAILDRVVLRDIVFRCADALAPDAELPAAVTSTE